MPRKSTDLTRPLRLCYLPGVQPGAERCPVATPDFLGTRQLYKGRIDSSAVPLLGTVGARSTTISAEKGEVFLQERTTRTVRLLATGMLSLGFLVPVTALPVVQARVATLERSVQPTAVTVHFARSGSQQEIRSDATTVADLLREQGITPTPEDAITPSLSTPLAEGLQISYRQAVPITLRLYGNSQAVTTAAPTVGALLAQRDVTLASGDYVLPKEDQRIRPGDVIRVVHVARWVVRKHETVKPIVEHRLALNLPPLASKTISHGTAAVKEQLVQYTRYDDNPQVEARVVASRVIRPGKPKIILSGIVAYDRYARLAKRGMLGTARLATAALEMVATAYTAGCAGCSGITAIGLPAGRGIVAVDPRVIPLGTRLYVKGYGSAIAGDTGGAIKGNRIDLGFDTYAAAERFGRQSVRVYVLK